MTGRDVEIRQLADVLLRRRQNNPILTGEAGVGKTAVVEGLAQRLVAGAVPKPLAGARLLALDLGALQAGAGVRGEFEQRLRGVLDGVSASPAPAILFIDEAHLLIGAGGQAGQGDAANLPKPALARGALRCVAATTWSEYKKHIEKAPALARRFEVVKVAEPEPEAAVAMLRGAAARFGSHHGVRILEEGLRKSVRLSHRYIAGRQLPDKAIGVLDTACARVAVSQSEPPPALADAQARLAAAALEDEAADLRETAAGLEGRWRAEQEAVAALPAALAAGDAAEIEYRRLTLETLQEGAEPLVHAVVDARAVSQVVSGFTGVPAGEMLREGAAGAQDLHARLRARVVAQDGALATIRRRIQTCFAQLGEPGKPTGAFLLAGPSGVGKTETAVALAAAIRPKLLRALPAAFLGALTVAPYPPPGAAQLGEIARIKLDALRERLAAGHGAALTWDRAVVEALVARATETESGARNLDAIIADTLAPQIAGLMLERIAGAAPARAVHVALGAAGFALEAR